MPKRITKSRQKYLVSNEHQFMVLLDMLCHKVIEYVKTQPKGWRNEQKLNGGNLPLFSFIDYRAMSGYFRNSAWNNVVFDLTYARCTEGDFHRVVKFSFTMLHRKQPFTFEYTFFLDYRRQSRMYPGGSSFFKVKCSIPNPQPWDIPVEDFYKLIKLLEPRILTNLDVHLEERKKGWVRPYPVSPLTGKQLIDGHLL